MMQQGMTRWRSAALNAAKSTLEIRWRLATEEWLVTRAEYLAILDTELTDVAALRKAAQRLRELQEQCAALTLELQEHPQ